jgi:hypothetical protein
MMVKTVLRAASSVTVATVGVGLSLLLSGIRLLAGSAGNSPAQNEISCSVRGGVLNYRTGKLDDGTDPVGWYERD